MLSEGATEWCWADDKPAREPEPEPQASVGWGGSKYPGGWAPEVESWVTELLQLDYFTLRQRSHELFTKNLYGRGIIRRLITNEVHVGLDLEAAPMEAVLGLEKDSLDEWTDLVESRFALWSRDGRVCDYEEKIESTFGILMAAARREAIVGGDVLVVLRQSRKTMLPTIQLIGGHMVRSPLTQEIPEGHEIVDGVEIDARGRHVAYYVEPDDFLGTSKRVAATGRNGRRIAWLMYGTDRRVGDLRGAPLLSIILQSLKEVDRYRDSTQRKALVNSLFAMWVEKTQDKPPSFPVSSGAVRTGTVTDETSAGTRSWNTADQIPGVVIEEGQHGEKIHAFTSQGTDDEFGGFESAIISAVGWALEIPPEILKLTFDKNYSASQAALNEFKMYLDVSRRTNLSVPFARPIYQDWLISEVQRGKIRAPGLIESVADPAKFDILGAWTNADWIGAVKPVTDMLKMVKAMQIVENMGWNTNAHISRELNGTKFSRNAEILRKERAMRPEPAAPAQNTAEARLQALEDRIDDNDDTDTLADP